MGEKHRVRFEPVGIDIDADEDETVLDAAFRHGVMLMHGCKEGQCGSCKSFMLSGDEGIEYELDRYSTFALPDYEKEQGMSLLCRAHAYDDLEVELLNYDEDMLRSGIPIQEFSTEVVANEPVTHDMRRLVLRLVDPPEIAFLAGQYVDIFVPGTGGHRAFSMANSPNDEDKHLEFVIKIYPDGFFSRFLDRQVSAGDRLTIKGPYGMCTMRDNPDKDVIFVGGGAGMAPLLSLIRSMAARGVERPATFYYGARTADDLCYRDEMHTMSERIPGFRFVEALSEPADGGSWDGPVGLISDVVDVNEDDLSGTDAYICGPPPMVEATVPVLVRHGVPEERIFYDKFTLTGSGDEEGGSDAA
ncbi:propane monooxygenase reductase subunit [Haloechinothrix alba]|uniref:Propane monooxygenase reductase subunit n=1 Tax=Haloechinothrix alba TaxID=664784 RepID=A0A238VKC0_9PSEU|nr:2Fe-2S iron-sulfur cluster binding domain-containing protein [Haloechinothrix alba]SNR34815.1 propane monooxygenase reductase subunit [Haloechinothrix alba]